MNSGIPGVSSELIVNRVDKMRMSSADVIFGFQRGYITSAEASRLALRERANGSQDEGLRRIADEPPHASVSIDVLPQDVLDASRDKWLYIWLDTVYRNRSFIRDPFRVVEMIYAEFDYPRDVAPFVRYMPLPHGETPGEDAILLRWGSYIDRKRSLHEA